jgi:hypothetical protein
VMFQALFRPQRDAIFIHVAPMRSNVAGSSGLRLLLTKMDMPPLATAGANCPLCPA